MSHKQSHLEPQSKELDAVGIYFSKDGNKHMQACTFKAFSAYKHQG